MADNRLDEQASAFAGKLVLTRPGGLKAAPESKAYGLLKSFGTMLTGNLSDGFFKTIETATGEMSDAEKGWCFAYAALQHCFDQTVAPLQDHGQTEMDMPLEHAVDLVKGKLSVPVDLDAFEVETNFLRQPKGLAVLGSLREALFHLQMHLEADETEAKREADRLPGRFASALSQLCVEYKDAEDAIMAVTQSSWAKLEAQEKCWVRAHFRLHEEIDKSLFGEPYSLRDLYQPLRAYRIEKEEDGSEIRHVVDLKTQMDGWAESGDPKNALQIVCGGPGSGKSSFAKMWAGEFDPAATRKVLMVPLHQPDADNLMMTVARYCKDHLGFEKNPIDRDEGEPELLLILDGLDELTMKGQTGLEAARSLLVQVQDLVASGNRGEKKAKLLVLVQGRELLVQSLSGQLGETPVWHLLGYHRIDPTKSEHEQARYAESPLLEMDQRNAWWAAWGELTRDNRLEGLPESIEDNVQLADLARTPLLNHLLALAWQRGQLDFGSNTNLNQVYADLLDHVWERSWGRSESVSNSQIPAVKRLERDDFDQIFEDIGLAAWQRSNTRSVRLADVKAIVGQNEALAEKLQTFQDGIKQQDAVNLLTAFFMSKGSYDGDQLFELTHKSFAEYFAAKRLVRLIRYDIRPLVSSPASKGVETALLTWYEATHANRMTLEIKSFLKNELALQARDKIEAWRADLIELFNLNLRDGMPIVGSRLRDVETHTAAAELALLAAISACTEIIVDRPGLFDARRIKSVRWHPAWPDQVADRLGSYMLSARDMFGRLECGQKQDSLLRECLTGIGLANQELGGAFLGTIHKVLVNLVDNKVEIEGIGRYSAKFADLGGSNLGQAELGYAKLVCANLKGAILVAANLSHANLTAADISKAALLGADFKSAGLSGANLNEANLVGAQNLTWTQVKSARNWETAKLPDYLEETRDQQTD